MEFLISFALAGVAVAAMLWVWARRRRRDHTPSLESEDFDPNDLDQAD